MDFQEKKKHFLLLQVNDALFPIGAYSHSYGLETYIQKEKVRSIEETWAFIWNRTLYGFCYNELLSAKLAYRYAAEENLEKLLELEQILEAARIPKETREAGRKLGSRFVKTMKDMELPFQSEIFSRYLESRKRKTTTHSVVYGVFCAALGMEEETVIEHYLYAQTSSMITNCVKTIPLSQTDGQKLLYRSNQLYEKVFETLAELTEDDLCRSVPGFDIRCMQHEGLYSRIYMS